MLNPDFTFVEDTRRVEGGEEHLVRVQFKGEGIANIVCRFEPSEKGLKKGKVRIDYDHVKPEEYVKTHGYAGEHRRRMNAKDYDEGMKWVNWNEDMRVYVSSEDFEQQVAKNAHISVKVVRIILALLSVGDIPDLNKGPILGPIFVQVVLPLIEAEKAELKRDGLLGAHEGYDPEVWHYGFAALLHDLMVCVQLDLLQHRHVAKIIQDVWNKYICYDLVQYLIESKLLDEVEGDALLTIVREVMAANTKVVEELKGGKEKAIGSLVGQIMKKQKADPVEIQKLIKQEIAK